jgi:MFS transporter, OPA family, solute carrier family 37 (glycerol-3-phosphate transporter), member 3
MVNYSFLFWLPFYLSNKFKWAESVADQISIWYDIGGIFGGIIGGLISDIINKRSVVIVSLLALAIPSLYFFSRMLILYFIFSECSIAKFIEIYLYFHIIRINK